MSTVLLYHDILEPNGDSSGFPGSGAARYKISRRDFDAHIESISNALHSRPDLHKRLSACGEDWADGRPVLTFDDGGVSAATIVADALQRRGWRGHFFITTDFIGQPGFVDVAQIRELARQGHGIGSHSCSHPTRMSYCSRSELLGEWSRSRQVLSDILGKPVNSASIPGGFYSRAVAEAAAEAGYAHLFSSEPTLRATRVGACQVIGRFTIYRGMTPSSAASLAAGAKTAMLRQAVSWKIRKALKFVGGKGYLAIRDFLLDRKYAATKIERDAIFFQACLAAAIG